jgi:hypothetical protein
MVEARRARYRNPPGNPAPDPTPEEIAERVAQIQAQWSHADRMHRLGWREPSTAAKPNGYAVEPPRGVVPLRAIDGRQW